MNALYWKLYTCMFLKTNLHAKLTIYVYALSPRNLYIDRLSIKKVKCAYQTITCLVIILPTHDNTTIRHSLVLHCIVARHVYKLANWWKCVIIIVNTTHYHQHHTVTVNNNRNHHPPSYRTNVFFVLHCFLHLTVYSHSFKLPKKICTNN